jgi:hypothetical protein
VTLAALAPAGSPLPAAGSSRFLLEWAEQDGVRRREPLTDCTVIGFESVAPVRSFTSYRGQRNWPGLWWSATMGCHVGYESWLERDQAMLLDFDPEVVGFAAQPFWLLFGGELGRGRSHAPDFFARHRDGSAVVIDCRPDDRIKPRDAEAFAATAVACELVGWDYQRTGAADPVLVENVRWLSGYRHPRFADPALTMRLLVAFAAGRALMDGVEATGRSVVVLPVLFHLLWHGQLTTGLSVSLSDTSMVWGARP